MAFLVLPSSQGTFESNFEASSLLPIVCNATLRNNLEAMFHRLLFESKFEASNLVPLFCNLPSRSNFEASNLAFNFSTTQFWYRFGTTFWQQFWGS